MTTGAEARLRRLLVMLPWLMDRGEVPLSAVAERFDCTVEEVERDLELVAMCGLPPFVDEMIDVFIDDGIVVIGVPRLFTRPLRLTAPEGFTLLAAGRAALTLPGADPEGSLGRGLGKIATALHDIGLVDELQAADPVVAVDLERPAAVDALAAAVDESTELSIDYYTPARDELSRRAIVPRHIFADSGRWYVVADDDRSDSRRTFRVDRIEALEPTGRQLPTDEPIDRPAFFDEDVPRATLRLAPSATWVTEHYPVDEVTEVDGGWLEVRLPVASDRWLARLLVRLGAAGECLEPTDAGAQAIELAERILARYAD